jgi:hypothetical protein
VYRQGTVRATDSGRQTIRHPTARLGSNRRPGPVRPKLQCDGHGRPLQALRSPATRTRNLRPTVHGSDSTASGVAVTVTATGAVLTGTKSRVTRSRRAARQSVQGSRPIREPPPPVPAEPKQSHLVTGPGASVALLAGPALHGRDLGGRARAGGRPGAGGDIPRHEANPAAGARGHTDHGLSAQPAGPAGPAYLDERLRLCLPIPSRSPAPLSRERASMYAAASSPDTHTPPSLSSTLRRQRGMGEERG